MEQKLVLAYEYHDADIVELLVTAWNGSFGGRTKLYVGQGELAITAASLSGFPISTNDFREVTFGAFGKDFAGGAVRFRLHCIDGAGHTEAEVEVESASWNESAPETVLLRATFEPAALDRFVTEMVTLSTSLHGEATLRFTIV